MNYLKAFSYISYISRILLALEAYKLTKDEQVLTQDLAGVAVEVSYPYHKGRVNAPKIRQGVEMIVAGIFNR